MLDHLHIQNYRLFKDLKIDKLGRVNLIAGKNNTGKTALLEAMRIWASKAHASVLANVIKARDEYDDNNWFSYTNLFTNRNYSDIFINNLSIKIQNIKEKYTDLYDSFTDLKLVIKYEGEEIREISSLVNGLNPIDELIYLPIWKTNDLDKKLYKNISFEEQDDVVEILQIILPNIKRFRIDDNGAKVLTSGGEELKLSRLGDGVNRLLTIALSIINAKNKILLIDEFEVGLHHSVQEQLWEIIFKYAKKWKIQVFVTTHSQDTVKAFSYVSSKEEFKDMGQYMRLQKSKINDEIEAVIYSKESLDYAIEDQLETR